MSALDKHRRTAERFESRLPGGLQRSLRWLRSDSARYVRMPVGILFIGGGVLGFLPILGFWMIPVGLFLLAEDVPPLRRAVRWMIVNGEVYWRRWTRRSGRSTAE